MSQHELISKDIYLFSALRLPLCHVWISPAYTNVTTDNIFEVASKCCSLKNTGNPLLL